MASPRKCWQERVLSWAGLDPRMASLSPRFTDVPPSHQGSAPERKGLACHTEEPLRLPRGLVASARQLGRVEAGP